MKKVLTVIFILMIGTTMTAQDLSIYDFDVTTIDGDSTKLKKFEGNVMLIVNTASKCGFTKQYEDLQKLYDKHKDEGLVILGFPCNQFGGQEPGTEKEIKKFCSLNFGVTFPMFSKINVNGEEQHPLYSYLKAETVNEPIKWNFEKFLVDKNGKVIDRFKSGVEPFNLEEKIAELL